MEDVRPERLDFPKVFAEVALGNQDAYQFCSTFLCWVHLIDDFIDKDKELPGSEAVVHLALEVLVTFACNPFWQANKAALKPLIFQGVNAFLDSNRWAKAQDFRDRATADVLKSQYQEVFWHVAEICGGWEHRLAITRQYRHYHYDAVG